MNMDSSIKLRLENEIGIQMNSKLENELEEFITPQPEVCVSLWDSLESDTESLVQEKTYQLELQKRIGSHCENAHFNSEHTHSRLNVAVVDDEEQDHQEEENYVYDNVSLEGSALRPKKRESANAEGHETVQRQIHLSDDYADLRYDPEWRRNLEGAQFLDEMRTRLSLVEGFHDSGGESEESVGGLEDLTGRGRCEYVIVSSQTPTVHAMADEMDSVQSEPPLTHFHLHPQQHQAICEYLPPSTFQSPHMLSERTASWNSGMSMKAGHTVQNQTCAAEHLPDPPEQQRPYREMNEQYDRAYQLFYEQECGTASGSMKEKQSTAPSKNKCSQQPSKTMQARQAEDFVERNKTTLGINAPKQGSYVRAYGQRGDKSDDSNQVVETTDETASTGSQESQADILDPEMMWQQKTQKLKLQKQVTQSHREKKARRRRGDDKPGENRRQARGARPMYRVYTSPPMDQPVAASNHQPLAPAEPLPMDEASSSSASDTARRPPARPAPPQGAPTANLSVDLTAAAGLAPFLGRDRQEGVVALVAPPPPPRRARPGAYNSPFSSPRFSHLAFTREAAGRAVLVPQAAGSPPNPSPALWPGQYHVPVLQGTGEPHLWGHDNTSVKSHNRARTIATKWLPPSREQNQSPRGEPIVQQDEESFRSGHTPQPQSSGAYAVLPPIGRTMASDSDLSSDRAGQRVNIWRSSSEGYLAQMEKQKQLKVEAGYKAYTLKDYKSIKQDVQLGGLGPTNTVTEVTAEKIRRQKLYSNVIREQNKKISRIPFLPARNPAGNDNKDVVPRRKALEYAKSIAKPKAPPRAKDGAKDEGEGVRERAQFLEGVDLSQLAALDVLRKRHEQEKQAVARFKVVHAV